MTDRVIVKVDAAQANRKLTVLPEAIRSRLRAVIVRNTKDLAAIVRANLSNSILKVRTGKLLGSIHTEMVENKQAVYGRVYSAGVPYAAIHEYGGVTSAHIIRPVNAQALHFFIGNKEFFRKLVHHPGSKIPERSYLRSALTAMEPRLVDEMTRAARDPGNWPKN